MDSQPTPGYKYDVFVSYSQDREWIPWVEKHFVPILSLWLKQELLRDAAIWWDRDLTPGQAWTQVIADRLARARVVVALWSPFYFQSEWCVSELAHMLTRQEKSASVTLAKEWSIVFPVTVHSQAGSFVPPEARHITAIDVTDEADPFMADGPMRGALSQKLRGLSKPLANAIKNPPAYDPDWPKLAFDEVMHLFYETSPVEQTTKPLIT